MTAPQLHQLFSELTKAKLTLSYDRQMTWAQYVQRGLTEIDLRLVVYWTRIQIQRGQSGFSELSLQFRALVADLDKFEDRLAIAKQSRAGRAFLARAGAPAEAEPATAPKPAAPALKQIDFDAAAAELQRWRESQRPQ